jgi:tetratricopeptide (TPR) repeat protein
VDKVDNQTDDFHSGKRLRVVRKMRSLRHLDLANEFNCVEGTIKKWQQRGVPQSKIIAVANYFDLPKELFSNDFQISEAEFENFLKNIRREVTDSSLPIPPPSRLPYENEDFPWDEVISGAGDEETFHFYVGCKCNAEGNFDQAIFNLNKALATETLDGQLLHEAYYARGYSWYKKNDLKKALTDYVESLAPESINAPIPPAYDKDLNRPYKRPKFLWYGEDLELGPWKK